MELRNQFNGEAESRLTKDGMQFTDTHAFHSLRRHRIPRQFGMKGRHELYYDDKLLFKDPPNSD